MGDKSRAHLYSELLAFLEARGRSLSEFGSAERGLTMEDAKTFLGLLSSNEVPILGVEIWREANGSLEVDGLETWYSTADQTARHNHLDALGYLASVRAGANDVFAIQFGGG